MDISLREVQKVVNKDPRVKKAFRPILYSCILIALGFIAFMVFGTMSSPSKIIELLAMAGGASILIGIVLSGILNSIPINSEESAGRSNVKTCARRRGTFGANKGLHDSCRVGGL